MHAHAHTHTRTHTHTHTRTHAHTQTFALDPVHDNVDDDDGARAANACTAVHEQRAAALAKALAHLFVVAAHGEEEAQDLVVVGDAVVGPVGVVVLVHRARWLAPCSAEEREDGSEHARGGGNNRWTNKDRHREKEEEMYRHA